MERSFSEDDLRAFVSGEAPASLADEIQTRIDADPVFRAEVAVLQGVKNMLSQDAAQMVPDELGWRRLEKQIRDDAQTAAPQAANSNFWRAAAVACGLVVVLQGAYIFSSGEFGSEPRYETATATEYDHVLALGFASGATIDDISAKLRELEGTVIGGPSALALYRVAFPTVEAMDAAQAALSESGFVTTLAKE